MDGVEVLGYVAFGLDVIATWMFAKKYIWAWPCSILSLTFWFEYGWILDQGPIIFSTATFFIICLYGWWSWWKDEQEAKRGQ